MYDDPRKRWLTFHIYIVLVGVGVGLLVEFFSTAKQGLTPIFVAAWLVFVPSLILLRRNRVTAAGRLLVFGSLGLMIWYYFQVVQTVNSIYIVGFAMLLPFSAFVLGYRWMLGITALSISIYVLLFLGESSGQLNPSPQGATINDLYMAILLTCFIAALEWFLARTNRVDAEKAQMIAETAYQRMFDNIPVGFYRSNPEGKLLNVNPSLLRLHGIESAEQQQLIQLGQNHYINPKRHYEFHTQLAQTGRVIDFESEISRASDRSSRWISETAYAVRDELGRLLYYEGTVRDISERKIAEAELVELSTQLRLITENVPAWISYIDKDECFQYVNYLYEELWGVNRSEIIGRKIADVIGLQSYYKIKERIHEALNGKEVHFQTRLTSYKGVPMFGDGVYVPYVVNNEVVGIIVMVRNITEQHMAKLALEKSEQQYRAITNTISDGVITLDRQMLITFANPAMSDIFGFSNVELVGRPIAVLVAHSLPTELDKSAEISNRRMQGRRRNGEEIDLEVSIRTWDDDGRIAATVIIRDITERLRTEARLQQTQRLESLGVLAGGIAHDFNNLLVAIMAQTSLSVRKLGEDHPVSKNIKKAVKSAERAADLCRQMLAYSGRGRIVIKAISLNEMIAENTELLRASQPPSIAFILNLEENLPTIDADVSQVQQVIMNLVINAAQAIGDNPGTITINTKLIVIERSDYHYWERTVDELQPGPYIRIRVEDTGCGMDEATLSKLFEPFFTTKSNGHGLGLAAVLGIIRGHNGGMHVASTPGLGTTFTIVFPVLARQTPA